MTRRTFDRKAGAILVQAAGAPGVRRCQNRREAGDELHFRRQFARWDCPRSDETRSARLDRILRARADRLRPFRDPARPLMTRNPCPCCGASRGGKFYLTEHGRQRLAMLRAKARR